MQNLVNWNSLIDKTIVLQATDVGINYIYRVDGIHDNIIILYDEECRETIAVRFEDSIDHCLIGRVFYKVVGILDVDIYKKNESVDFQDDPIQYELTGTIQKTQIETDYLNRFPEYDYWINDELDRYFDALLEEIGEGKNVKVTIEVVE